MKNLTARYKAMSTKAKMEIWVAIGTIGVIVSGFEIFGLDERIPWSHTISFYSQAHKWLFVVILVLFLALPVWWIWHILFTHIPKLVRKLRS